MTRTFNPGQTERRSATSGAASTTCSKLSSTSSRRLSRRNTASCASSGSVPVSRKGKACAMAETTRSGLVMGARSTNQIPSENASTRLVATWRARRVLPTPPGPVKVSRRISSWRSRSTSTATSRSRPTSGVSGAGRFVDRADGDALDTDTPLTERGIATLREIVGGVPPPVNACGWIVRPTRIRSAAAGAIAASPSRKVARLLRADRCGAPDPTREDGPRG